MTASVASPHQEISSHDFEEESNVADFTENQAMFRRRRRERALRAASSLAGSERAFSESFEWESIPGTSARPFGIHVQTQEQDTLSYDMEAAAEVWRSGFHLSVADHADSATLAITYPSQAPTLKLNSDIPNERELRSYQTDSSTLVLASLSQDQTLQVAYGLANDEGIRSQHADSVASVDACPSQAPMSQSSYSQADNKECRPRDFEEVEASALLMCCDANIATDIDEMSAEGDGKSIAAHTVGSECNQDAWDAAKAVTQQHHSNECIDDRGAPCSLPGQSKEADSQGSRANTKNFDHAHVRCDCKCIDTRGRMEHDHCVLDADELFRSGDCIERNIVSGDCLNQSEDSRTKCAGALHSFEASPTEIASSESLLEAPSPIDVAPRSPNHDIRSPSSAYANLHYITQPTELASSESLLEVACDAPCDPVALGAQSPSLAHVELNFATQTSSVCTAQTKDSVSCASLEKRTGPPSPKSVFEATPSPKELAHEPPDPEDADSPMLSPAKVQLVAQRSSLIRTTSPQCFVPCSEHRRSTELASSECLLGTTSSQKGVVAETPADPDIPEAQSPCLTRAKAQQIIQQQCLTNATPAQNSTDCVAHCQSTWRASCESPVEATRSPRSLASQEDPKKTCSHDAQDAKIPLLSHAIAQLAQHHSSLIRIMPIQNTALHIEHEQDRQRSSAEKIVFESPRGVDTRELQSPAMALEKLHFSTQQSTLICSAQTQKSTSFGADQQPTVVGSMESASRTASLPQERAPEASFEPDAEPDARDTLSPLLSFADAQIATRHGSQVQHETVCMAQQFTDSIGDSYPTSSYGSAATGRRVRLTGKRRIASPVQENVWSVAAGLLTSARKLQKVRRACSSDIRESIGHSLSPPEQGVKVRVIGDGWGGGSGEYLATITEADSSTFTVIRCKKPSCDAGAWEETHVLREKCIPVLQKFSSEKTTRGAAKRRKRG